MDGFWAVQQGVDSSRWISRIHATLPVAMMLRITVAEFSLKYKSTSPADHFEQFHQMNAARPLLQGKLTFSRHDQSPNSPHPGEDKRRVF